MGLENLVEKRTFGKMISKIWDNEIKTLSKIEKNCELNQGDKKRTITALDLMGDEEIFVREYESDLFYGNLSLSNIHKNSHTILYIIYAFNIEIISLSIHNSTTSPLQSPNVFIANAFSSTKFSSNMYFFSLPSSSK